MEADDWGDSRWANNSTAVDDLAPAFALGFWAISLGAPFDAVNSIRDVSTAQASTQSQSVHYRCDLEDIGGVEDEFISYLRSLSKPVGGSPRIGPRLDLSLELRSVATGLVIGFPWWDRLDDMEPFFEWLRGPEEPFIDLEQGWIFSGVKRGSRLHFRTGHSEVRTETANVSVAMSGFLARLHPAEAAARAIAGRLERELPTIS